MYTVKIITRYKTVVNDCQF